MRLNWGENKEHNIPLHSVSQRTSPPLPLTKSVKQAFPNRHLITVSRSEIKSRQLWELLHQKHVHLYQSQVLISLGSKAKPNFAA